MLRKIIQIEEERCDGCGLCAQACHEGAAFSYRLEADDPEPPDKVPVAGGEPSPRRQFPTKYNQSIRE